MFVKNWNFDWGEAKIVIFLHRLHRMIQKYILTNKWTCLFFALSRILLSSWGLGTWRILTLWKNVCFSAQNDLRHFQKCQKYIFILAFWKLDPSISSKIYVIDKLNNSYMDCCSLLMLPIRVYFTWRKFSLLAHPQDEAERTCIRFSWTYTSPILREQNW